MPYKDVTPPAWRENRRQPAANSIVPDNPILPLSSCGDGTGPDIWAASERVFDAAVKKSLRRPRKIS